MASQLLNNNDHLPLSQGQNFSSPGFMSSIGGQPQQHNFLGQDYQNMKGSAGNAELSQNRMNNFNGAERGSQSGVGGNLYGLHEEHKSKMDRGQIEKAEQVASDMRKKKHFPLKL